MKFHKISTLRLGASVSLSLAISSTTGKRFLLKELAVPDHQGYLARQLRAEFDLLRSVDHPGLLKPVAMLDQDHALVYPEVAYSLAQLLANRGKLPFEQVASLVGQVAQALDGLHEAGYCHGSLDPHSVLVTPGGDVVLGDFLGHKLDSPDPFPDPDPFPKYQAPECYDAAFGLITLKTDLYSLGFLALEALTGKDFPGLFPLGQMGEPLAWHLDPLKKLEGLSDSLPHVPAGFVDLIKLLIEKSPHKRGFRSAKDLLRQLSRRDFLQPAPLPVSLVEPKTQPVGAPSPAGEILHRILVLKARDEAGVRPVVLVPGKPVLIGSQAGCDWRPGTVGLDNKHAILQSGPDGQWYLYDLRAKGECRVNEQRAPVLPVREGDTLSLGNRRYSAELAETLLPSRTLFGVQIARELSRGHEGRSYLGLLAKKSQPVLLRVFPEVFNRQEAWVRRLLQDGARLGNNPTRAILTKWEAGRRPLKDGRMVWYLILSYPLRGNLVERIEQADPVSPGRLVVLASTACRALSDAHALKVVHGNLHPGCIWFDGSNRIRLSFVPAPLDPRILFRDGDGKAQLASHELYRAPELFGTGSVGDQSTDVYALAATLLHFLTGKKPFDPGNASLVGVRKLKEMELPAFCPLHRGFPLAKTIALFRKALHPDPAARFRAPRDFLAALHSMLAASPRVHHHRPDPARRSRQISKMAQ